MVVEKTRNLLTEDILNIFDSLFDGIFITNNKGECLWVNKAYERITELKAGELIGKNVQQLVDEGIVSHAVSTDVLKEKKRKTINQTLYSGKQLLITGNPVFDKTGQIYLVVTNVRDITELARLEKEIQEYKRLQERYSVEIQVNQFEKTREQIFIKSQSMQKLYELIYRISNIDSNVLITGETGVGKEFIANMIHQTSIRKNGPFIKINCGAIPAHLLESELFGFEEGAFTGAKKTGKIGLFQMADKGTILLDEIGDLPLELQVKLLRAVQHQEFIPIGGTKPVKIDTRIIAATNKNLEEEVKKGKFRQDLYYRLNVISMKIPPLRERREDIFYLSQFFLHKMNKKYGFQKRFSAQLISILEKYHWPGNIRELENVIERIVVTSAEDLLDAHHIQDMIQSPVTDFSLKPLKEAVAEYEANLIKKAMDLYNNTYKAAAALGIDQSTLVRKRQKYKM